ncbi:aminotransferase class IV [Sphingobacterium rhinopitheci]|uniref:aminotransferase class IV n=1 Tax=Sphingobacterium rhinopitheci TaxID=2781960 RepID=UPI001F51D41B|nr:aminotransferase class IV [Sphingobacterium rhinopitheci]MCI0922122.1 aminotransferase class IV [Sphingobacterium rhinopitheci]
MPVHYINHNGTLVPQETNIITADSRAFRYGDGLFETMLYQNGEIRFLPFHVERLQSSMERLHFDNPQKFDEYFIKIATDELIRKNNMIGQRVRVRLIVYRDGGGLYAPISNKAGFIIQVDRIITSLKDKKIGLIVGLYEEYKKSYSDLSDIKSNNALIYVMAGLYKQKFDFDDVLIINQEGYLCEGLSSNVFVYYEKTLYTPALNQGCINGVMRRVVMDIAEAEGIPVVEAQINPAIMKKADEIFCTNAIQGIQWVMGYKQKRYFNKISRVLQERLKTWSYEEEED